jgi:hypothetical protein
MGGLGQAANIAGVRTLDIEHNRRRPDAAGPCHNRRRSDAAIRTMLPPAEPISADEPWRFVAAICLQSPSR